MTQREKKLATVLLSVVAVMAAASPSRPGPQPYREASARLNKLKDDLDDKEADLLKEKKQIAS